MQGKLFRPPLKKLKLPKLRPKEHKKPQKVLQQMRKLAMPAIKLVHQRHRNQLRVRQNLPMLAVKLPMLAVKLKQRSLENLPREKMWALRVNNQQLKLRL